MALHGQVWPPATPMPMVESSLYRQRLEVIEEKRRLQEEIRAVRRELEEEKLRLERLKRKSLRERWLMDGSAEGSEPPEDPASKDPQSPEGQAQARIRNLENSLFTLQSQLQLLHSASTGAQHRPAGRPTWRRQGPRPLSQPTLEADPEGHSDVNKRASLPAGPVGISPESPSESKEEPAGASSEANGPCPGRSPLPGQSPSPATAEGGIDGTKREDVVEVVWEGLRPTEDCAVAPTGPELEAKVEEVVLETLGARQRAGSIELPAWVKEDRSVVEVVWEGLGGSDSAETTETSSQRPQEHLEAEASRKDEGVPKDSLEGDRQGGPVGEEGSFIWVERVNLSEDWEELLMEGLEGPTVPGTEEGRAGAQPGPDRVRVEVKLEERGTGERGGEERREGEGVLSERKTDQEKWEVEVEGDEKAWEVESGGEENPEATGETLVAETKDGDGEAEGGEKLVDGEAGRGKKEVDGEAEGGEKRVDGEAGRGEKEVDGEAEGGEKRVDGETERSEKEVDGEAEGGEKRVDGETERGEKEVDGEAEGGEKRVDGEAEGGEKRVDGEAEGGEKRVDGEAEGGEKLVDGEAGRGEKEVDGEAEGGEKRVDGETERSEKEVDGEAEGGEKLVDGEREGGERPLEGEKIQRAQGEVSSEEQRALGEGGEPQAEAVNEAGTPQDVKLEDQGLGGSEKQEGLLEEVAGKPQPLAEGQGLPADTTPLLAEAPVPEQPAESQPLLQQQGASANPSAHPAPTYAPARQPEPASRTEGEETSGPKQKTCQCCVVM